MPTDHPSILAARLAALAAERGWSLAAVSRRAQLGRGAVADIVAHPERRPRDSTLARIARALDVDAAYLTGASDARHATGRLTEGLAELAADHPARALMGAMLEALREEGSRFAAFQVTAGGTALGIPDGSTVIVDREAEPRSGDVILANRAGDSALRYVAEPYLIGSGRDGRLVHEVGARAGEVVGRVILTLRAF